MRKVFFHKYYKRLLVLLCAYFFLVSPASGLNHWQKIEAKGYLTWVTRPSPLTYYTSLDGVIGLEYDILKQFCDYHNIKLTVINAESNNQLFEYFDGYNVDVAGANLTLTVNREDKYLPSIKYDETYISLISSSRKPRIKSLDNLSQYNGVVLDNSSYVATATSLIQEHQANIAYLNDMSLYDLLHMVARNEIDYTLSDSNIMSLYAAYIPKLRIGAQLTKPNDLVFYMRKNGDESLKNKLDDFIKKYVFQNKVNRYKDFLVKSLPNSKPADTVQFLKNYKNRWPQVQSMIYKVAEKYEVSPILLAAISYQESHWNAKAISPTHVKGLMMLTKAVASEQNVNDRFDPMQSLEGGTRYFLEMMSKVPERIVEPNKTKFALAAYNIGYGNLEKARVKTQRAGKDPDVWQDVKIYLPKLKNADGKTAVRYVENILVYQNLLQWKEQQ
ncbi:MAG: transglycosylase SLT domain-containing protein [Marinicellaceae bacterium]